MLNKIKILIVSHKPFKIPAGNFYLPVHAGRDVALEFSKDGKINNSDYLWMLNNTVGDNVGENISLKNRLYSESTVIYWAWKNYERLGNPDYVGLMHYRRHFIFDDNYYNETVQNNLETALAYISENFIDNTYINKIGLNDESIEKACEEYDLIVSKDSELSKINGGRNVREDYALTIAGTYVKDFDLMVKIVKKKYPEYANVVAKGIYGHKKSLYHMFIMRRELFFEYCEFLFNILFELERQTDFTNYSTNGKRTLGYLAEELLAFFVWKKQEENQIKILKLGCTLVEYPYDEVTLKHMLAAGCPKLIDYIYFKVKSFFLRGVKKQINKEIYQGIRNQRKSYFKLKKMLHRL